MENKTGPAKVYSPDITPFSFEGDSYFLGTTLSIVIAPIRLVSRVMHNVLVLPADMQERYADSLLFVSGILMAIGFIDAVLYHKVLLLLSQVVSIAIAVRLKSKAQKSTEIAKHKREIKIDVEPLEEECNNIYDILDTIIGE